jgi:hypothetical protein
MCGHDKEKTNAAQSIETWTKGDGLIIRETEFVLIQGEGCRMMESVQKQRSRKMLVRT